MKFGSKLNLLTGVALSATMLAAPVWAQDADADEVLIPGNQSSAAAAEFVGDDIDDEIVVTGSRIRRQDLETSFPTTIIGGELFEERAFTNVIDALTELPSFGTGPDQLGDQGANIGVNFSDLFDLGSQRTLTVINGRRVVSSDVSGGGLAVDLNIIPTNLIERIDIVTVGGAPVYGSDAIAGTVNVILKEDFEGLEASVQYGETDRGDGDEQQYSFLAGTNSADGRFNLTFGAQYTKDDALLQTDRPDTFVNEPFLSDPNPGTAGFTDIDADGDGDFDAVFRAFNLDRTAGLNVQLFTNGGVISPGATFIPSLGLGGFDGQFFQFAPNGDLVDLPVGETVPGTSVFFAQGGNPNDFFGSVDQIRSPLEQINVSSSGRYEISDFVTAKAEFLFSRSEADESVDQGGFQTFAFGGTSGALSIPVSNPFLNSQAQGVLSSLGFDENDPENDTFVLSRFNNDLLGGGLRSSETNLFRIAGGLEGEFEFAGRDFYWDVYGIQGEATVETSEFVLNDLRFLNAIEAVSLTADDVSTIAAAGASPIGDVGDIVCAVTRDFARGDVPLEDIRGIVVGSGVNDTDDANDVTACQPLNLFGENAGSPAAIDYVQQRAVTLTDIEQQIFTVNFGGSLIDLPAGQLGFNIGYEARNESGDFLTDGTNEVGLGRNAATPDTGGSFSTNEYYAEVAIPLVSDDMNIPLVHNLEFDGVIREINNSLAGDSTIWTAGGRYSPVQDLQVRGNATRSVRAPSLVELFQPVVTAFSFANDPCDASFIDDGPNRAANCAAVGIPDGFASNVVNATAQGTTGGNPDLSNETSNSFTIGGVLQPRWIPGLTLQGDYINIEIEDQIGVISLESNLETCFDADPGDFPNAACSQFTRDENFQIVDFTSGQLNADSAEFQFLEFRGDYGFDVADAFSLFGGEPSSDLGFFGINAYVFHVIQRDVTLAGVLQDSTVGSFADPRWSGTVDLLYNNNGFSAAWRTLWQDRELFDPAGEDFFADENDNIIESVGGRFMHNATVAFDLSTLSNTYEKPVIASVTVNNIFDRGPGDNLRRLFGNFGTQELLGREFVLRLRASF